MTLVYEIPLGSERIVRWIHSFIHSFKLIFTSILREVQPILFKGITNKQSYLMRQRELNKYSMEASSGSRGLCRDAWGQTLNRDKNELRDKFIIP